MHDYKNTTQLRQRLEVIRHRIPGTVEIIRQWLIAAVTLIHRWIAPRATRVSTQLGSWFAGTRVGQLLIARWGQLDQRLDGKLNGRGPQVAVAMLILMLAGLAAIGGTAGNDGPQGSGTTAQSVLAGRDAERADRSARTTAPPAVAAPAAPAPAAPAPPAVKPPWVAPMPNSPVTSCYGMRGGVPHLGIDFALPPGTPVHSIGVGKVLAAGWLYSGYGISVVVDHGNGYQSHYAHLQGVAVSAGQQVATDQVIGYEGTTGDSSGPHLHFEIHHGMWNQVEPAAALRSVGVALTGCQ